MKLTDTCEMRREDSNASEKFGIPGIILMENAAGETVRYMEENADLEGKKVLVLCGGGNNGGDGFAIARKLFCKGIEVYIFFAAQEEMLTESARMNYRAAVQLGIPFAKSLEGFDVMVDALLGIGITGDVRADFAEIINKINAQDAVVYAVDVPSGLCADTGRVCGCAVAADYTVAMAYGKPGLFTGRGKKYAGKVLVADICLPPNKQSTIELVDEKLVQSFLPQNNVLAHKGTNGTLAVAAGSRGMTGAATLCCLGALKSSAGIVKLLVPQNLNDIMEVKLTEAVTVPIDSENCFKERDAEILLNLNADAMVIGPGISRDDGTIAFVQSVVKNARVPLVIDADGIYAVSANIDILKEAKAEIILTPHPGEFSRLTGASVSEIENNRIEYAKKFAAKYGVTVLLKGAGTVIAEPNGKVYINSTGNEGMAKGGSGDVLAGIIGAFLCRGAVHPAAVGAYIHGKAGDRAAEKIGKTAMLPTDILNYI